MAWEAEEETDSNMARLKCQNSVATPSCGTESELRLVCSPPRGIHPLDANKKSHIRGNPTGQVPLEIDQRFQGCGWWDRFEAEASFYYRSRCGMPAGLAKAFAGRMLAGNLQDLILYYRHSVKYAGETIVRREVLEKIKASN